MSKLEELIKEFCPNGVEYKKLGELGKFYGGLSGKSKNDFTNGNEKFITYKNVYANPSLNLDVEDRVKINPGERQNTLQYGDIIFTGSSETPDECGFSSVITTHTSEKLYLNSFCFFFRLDNQSILLPDFAKHLFRAESIRYQIGKTASGVTRYNVSKDKMKQVQIPLPALPVQREIVRILDSFTLYSAELTAELTARRKQYEFYRDKLLNFENFIEKRKLEECCNILDNKRKPITQSARVAGIYPYYGANGIQDYVAEYLFDGEFILVGEDGSVITENGNPIITWAVGKIWVNNHAHIIQNNGKVNFRFLFHYLHIIDIKKLVHGNIPKLTGKDFKELQIPIPPMEVQERIVKVLDNFDAICSDLGIGLPAEIEKRQKQYEYYREKLLTFDGKYATILTERNGTERNGQG